VNAAVRAPRVCFACGNARGIYPVGALNDSFTVCGDCRGRYLTRFGPVHGMRLLRREADRLLSVLMPEQALAHSNLPPDKRGVCWHCGAKVLPDLNGNWPIICQACDRERMRCVGAGSASA
jgi:hypothetical protein